MATAQDVENPSILYRRLDEYDWDSDREFQGGLNAILNSVTSLEQSAHLTLRAKCYYFARKFGTTADFEGYKAWTESPIEHRNGSKTTEILASTTTSSSDPMETSPASSGLGNAPPPASFAEICELIAAGKPIPGIKDIPDTILEGQGTQSHATARKKPWEKDATPAPTPSWAT